MQAESTSENGGKDEKANKGAYNERKQVEQPGKRRETQEIHKRVDQLLSVCRHEESDGRNGQMVTPQNPSGVLETMEKGTHEISDI